MNRLHFSSAICEWETPDGLFEKLRREFPFALDVCANADNAKCERYFTETDNGLAQAWRGVCWMNPPYGQRVIAAWVRKAHEEAGRGATVVCLLPSRTETAWWHDCVMRAAEIRFIRGRLRFSGHRHNAPFPSAVVVFKHTKGQSSGPKMLAMWP